MAKRVHVAGIFVSCISNIPRAFVCTPNSRAALTIHAKLFTFTRVKRVHARVHTHACVKFKVSGTVDDILVSGENDEQHLENLAAVLDRLEKYGLRGRFSKCQFFQDSVEYLGDEINQEGIRPLEKK